MSEQHENTELRIREALLAEASEAPSSQDSWARVEPRLERPATPFIGWQRRWRVLVAGTAAAVVIAIGGAGTALIATGQFSESEDGGIQGSVRWIGVDGEDRETIVDDETNVSLDDREGNRLGSSEMASGALAIDPGMPGEPTQASEPPTALERAKTVIVTSQASSENPQGSASERQVISQASMDLEVSDVNTASIQLRGLVQSFGGFIEHISTSGGPNPEHGSAVVRVPSDRFLEVLDGIERLGKAVGQTLGQRDVTGEAIDLEARLRSEQSAEQSLLKLLDRAVSVSDVLTVERELKRVRADIERLQGQLEFIQRSVALATITVSFVLPPGSVPVAPSASMQVKVDDVERSVILVRELVDQAGGTMGRVIIRTRQDSQEAFLSFSVPASVLDGALASMVGDGVVLHREVESDGRLRQGEPGDDLQARVTVNLHTNKDSDLWRSTGILVAGGILVFLGIAGTLALVFRARRGRA